MDIPEAELQKVATLFCQRPNADPFRQEIDYTKAIRNMIPIFKRNEDKAHAPTSMGGRRYSTQSA